MNKTTSKNMSKHPPESAIVNARALSRLGHYLDSVDSGRVPVLAKQYQTVARAATQLIAARPRCPLLLEVVALSPALKEVLSNLALAKEITLGEIQLPEYVTRVMHQAR